MHFKEVQEGMMDPELEQSFQDKDGELEPEAKELLEAAFATWKPQAIIRTYVTIDPHSRSQKVD